MVPEFVIAFIWIPSDLGGHRSAPWQGMRATIRWQRYIKEHLQLRRDVEAVTMIFDEGSRRGSARLRLTAPIPVPSEWLEPGVLIELLDGANVIAVGSIQDGGSMASAQVQ